MFMLLHQRTFSLATNIISHLCRLNYTLFILQIYSFYIGSNLKNAQGWKLPVPSANYWPNKEAPWMDLASCRILRLCACFGVLVSNPRFVYTHQSIITILAEVMGTANSRTYFKHPSAVRKKKNRVYYNLSFTGLLPSLCFLSSKEVRVRLILIAWHPNLVLHISFLNDGMVLSWVVRKQTSRIIWYLCCST
jgi:hypothetical protein